MSEGRTNILLRSLVALVVTIAMGAVVITGVNYLGQGIGGVVPFLMIVVAPILAGFYIWYLLIRRPS